MAVTQYIGARYVPVFADPAEWSSTRTYEPLTIVTHQGNSFTSRQYVPAGIDITNTDYWVETGTYNAQVEAYRKEVGDYKTATDTELKTVSDTLTTETAERKEEDTKLANSVTQLSTDTKETTNALATTDRTLRADLTDATQYTTRVAQNMALKNTYDKIIYLGDSWGLGYYENADHTDEGVAARLASILGATLVNKSVGGAGFYAGTNFKQQWDNTTADERNGADLVVICGGQNDMEQTRDHVVDTAIALFDELKTFQEERKAYQKANPNVHAPSVRVVVLPYPLTKYRTFVPTQSVEATDVPDSVKAFMEIPNYARQHGFSVSSGCYRWCSTLTDTDTDDAYHLKAAAYNVFAEEAAEFITSGSDFYPTNYDQLQIPEGVPYSSYRNNQVYENNGVVTIRFAAEASAEIASGTILATIPTNISPGHRFYYEAGLREGRFLAVDPYVTNGITYTNISLQGGTILGGDWTFINLSYPAAL